MAIELTEGLQLYPQYSVGTQFTFSSTKQNTGETRSSVGLYFKAEFTASGQTCKFVFKINTGTTTITCDTREGLFYNAAVELTFNESTTMWMSSLSDSSITGTFTGLNFFNTKPVSLGTLSYATNAFEEKTIYVSKNSYGFLKLTVQDSIKGKYYISLPDGVYAWVTKTKPSTTTNFTTAVPDNGQTGKAYLEFPTQGIYYLCIGRKNEGESAPIISTFTLKKVPVYTVTLRSGNIIEEINEQAFEFTIPTFSSLTQISPPDSTYGFLGWCETTNSSQIDYVDGANFIVQNEDTFFYDLFAVWGRKNIATLNFGYPVSQTEEIEGWQKAYNSNIDTLFIESGATARLPVKNDAYDHSDGRIFLTKGWRLFRDGEFASGQDILFEDTFTTILPNDIFYIIYSNSDLGIKYLANGDYTVTGEVPDDFKEQTIVAGTFSDASFAIKQNEYVYGKNKFKYWCDTPDGKGTRYTHGQEVTLNSSLTLYGIWDYVGVGGGGATLYYGYKGKWVEVNLGG